MVITAFPDPTDTGPEGIVAVGGDLDPESLILAYSQGIFPWPISLPEDPSQHVLAWFCPPRRAVLFFKDLHIPRSLSRTQKKAPFTFTIDRAFREVMENCAQTPRPGQSGTWITAQVLEGYTKLFKQGHAHSVEAWKGKELAGGIYGVDAGGAFAGESMFFRKPYASKLALLHLVEHLRARGAEWLDIQVMTPHMKALGAREITRRKFLELLSQARARNLRLF